MGADYLKNIQGDHNPLGLNNWSVDNTIQGQHQPQESIGLALTP